MDEEHTIIDISSMLDSNITIVSNPSVGDVWLNTMDNNIYINDGMQWNTVGITPELQEWTDKLPDLEKVEKMCKDYPALEKAYENFKTVYKMVEQDWIGNQKSDQGSLF